MLSLFYKIAIDRGGWPLRDFRFNKMVAYNDDLFKQGILGCISGVYRKLARKERGGGGCVFKKSSFQNGFSPSANPSARNQFPFR